MSSNIKKRKTFEASINCIVHATISFLLLYCASASPLSSPGDKNHAFVSIKQLRESMYEEVLQIRSCYRILNSTGYVGCSAAETATAGFQAAAPLILNEDLMEVLLDLQAVSAGRSSTIQGGKRSILDVRSGEDESSSSPTKIVSVVVTSLQLLPLLRMFVTDAPVPGTLSFINGSERVTNVRISSVIVVANVTAARTSYEDPPNLSAAPRIPMKEFDEVDGRNSTEWNPFGSGLEQRAIPFAMFWPAYEVGLKMRDRAVMNARRGWRGAVNVAEAELSMLGTESSEHCLSTQTCLPVGGYGVWTSFPPLVPSEGAAKTNRRRDILILAAMDSNSLFHDLTRSAESALSGLLVLAASVQLLAHVITSSPAATTAYPAPSFGLPSNRTLIFAALAGEPWTAQGSRRLAWELGSKGQSQFVKGLDPESFDAILDLNTLGRARDLGSNHTSFYLHALEDPDSDGDYSFQRAFEEAAQMISGQSGVNITVNAKTVENLSSIPPSSVKALKRSFPNVSRAAVLNDYDSVFKSPLLHSELDSSASLDRESLINAALLVSQTLAILAFSDPNESAQGIPRIDRSQVQIVVSDLWDCLLASSPGLDCPLARELIQPTPLVVDGVADFSVPGYVGVLRSVNLDPQDDADKTTFARFLFNYLANATAAVGDRMGDVTKSSETLNSNNPSKDLEPGGVGWPCITGSGSGPDFGHDKIATTNSTVGVKANEADSTTITTTTTCRSALVCVGWKGGRTTPSLMGRCRRTTTKYIPSYSTRLSYDAARDVWQVMDSFGERTSQEVGSWPLDPLWAESNWPSSTPHLRVFMREARGSSRMETAWGILVTAISVVACVLGKKWIEGWIQKQSYGPSGRQGLITRERRQGGLRGIQGRRRGGRTGEGTVEGVVGRQGMTNSAGGDLGAREEGAREEGAREALEERGALLGPS